MYILWSRGSEPLEFPMNIENPAGSRKKRESHAHGSDGTIMAQLLRADKLEIPEK